MPLETDTHESATPKQDLLHNLHCLHCSWNRSFVGDDLGRNQRQRIRLEVVAHKLRKPAIRLLHHVRVDFHHVVALRVMEQRFPGCFSTSVTDLQYLVGGAMEQHWDMGLHFLGGS